MALVVKLECCRNSRPPHFPSPSSCTVLASIGTQQPRLGSRAVLSQPSATMAAEKKAPVFKQVQDLRPGTQGHNLHVKVLEATTVIDRQRGPKGQPLKVAECIVGDATGSIVFTARNEQVELAKAGAFITLRNAKIDMFRGSMRLAVDQWGKVEAYEGDKFEAKTDNNLSLVEYELVPVAAGAAPAAEPAAAAATS